jgi:sugar phosphate isomerase/epimerase
MYHSKQLTRRDFLQQTASFALTAGLVGAAGHSRAAESRKPWIVACRDAHLAATGKADCWAAMKELGIGGVEMVVNLDLRLPGMIHPTKQYRLDSPDNIASLKDDFAANGMVPTAFAMANQFDQRLPQELEWTKRLVPAAQQLGIKAIRIDVVPHTMKREDFLPFAIKACKQLCEIAEGTEVRFGVENHGNTTNDPEFLSALFDGVGSSHLGQTLDVGNFYWYGHKLDALYKLYERFGAHVVHTHCKNIRYPEDQRNAKRPIGWEYDRYVCPLYEGDIDYKKLTDILRQANYAGDLCIEDESLGKYAASERPEILKKEAAFLKKFV